MKRIVIVCILFILCLGVSIYSVQHTQLVNETILASVTRCLNAVEADDHDALIREVEGLSAFWEEEEDYIIHFIRHAQIDEVTKSIARLRALALGEDYTELMAELDTIRWQMEHINRSETNIFANLL